MVEVLESHGLQLTFLKCQGIQFSRTHIFEYKRDKVTQEDEEDLHQPLFFLNKFCVSDKLYHELTFLNNDLPRSYLIKQKRSDLNKLSHVERVPDNYPGPQITFVDKQKDHSR